MYLAKLLKANKQLTGSWNHDFIVSHSVEIHLELEQEIISDVHYTGYLQYFESASASRRQVRVEGSEMVVMVFGQRMLG